MNKLVILGKFAVELAVGKNRDIRSRTCRVSDDALIRGDWHERFPTVREHRRALHGELIQADDDVGRMESLTRLCWRLSHSTEKGYCGVIFTGQPVGVRLVMAGVAQPTSSQGSREQREDFFTLSIARLSVTQASALVKLDLGRSADHPKHGSIHCLRIDPRRWLRKNNRTPIARIITNEARQSL